ncbi:MAG: hypothetical protein AAF974_10335 [Cyanobacteria bacterium P01_E01_bin.34]
MFVSSVVIGLAIALAAPHSLAQDSPVTPTARQRHCSTDIDRWAAALLEDLPAYANRQLVISGAENRILAAGFPDIDFPTDITDIAGLSEPSEVQEGNGNLPEEVARVFFSTAERTWGSTGPRSERAYRLLLTRRPGGIWLPQSLEIAKATNLEPTDVTGGAIWQAIQRWQDAGCPSVQYPER